MFPFVGRVGLTDNVISDTSISHENLKRKIKISISVGIETKRRKSVIHNANFEQVNTFKCLDYNIKEKKKTDIKPISSYKYPEF
jgi:hypothetical protein